MFTPTRAYTQAELFVPLFVPPASSDGPIYSSFKARPPPSAAQIAKTKSYLEIFHRKWDTLPDHIRATLSPPVPDLMPSGRVNASENSREPASNSVPAYSSSDEDDNEEVTTPSTFDASMVKDAIKRHLQKFSFYTHPSLQMATYIVLLNQLDQGVDLPGVHGINRSNATSRGQRRLQGRQKDQ